MYDFTLQGGTWIDHKNLTANDGAFNDYFGSSVAISGDTFLFWASGKYGEKGSAYAFFLAGDVTWNEGTKFVPRNGIASRYYFGYAVALSSDRALVGSYHSDLKGGGSGVAYISFRIKGVWQYKTRLFPTDGSSYDYFGYYVALSGDKYIIGSLLDYYMGSESEYVYLFVRWGGGTWEEVQKLKPVDGEAGDRFGFRVAISGDNYVIGAGGDDIERVSNRGSGYLYTKIG